MSNKNSAAGCVSGFNCHITINTVRNPDFKTLLNKVQQKCILCKKHIFLCILYTIFVLFYFVSFCFILHFYAFVKCVVSSTFSAHLPLLALGTTDVSGCVALAREHTRTAGRTHAARAFCEVIKHLAYNTVEWVLIAQWQKGRREAKLEGVTINSEGNHLLGRHKCWSDPGWTACDLDESSWE